MRHQWVVTVYQRGAPQGTVHAHGRLTTEYLAQIIGLALTRVVRVGWR